MGEFGCFRTFDVTLAQSSPLDCGQCKIPPQPGLCYYGRISGEEGELGNLKEMSCLNACF